MVPAKNIVLIHCKISKPSPTQRHKIDLRKKITFNNTGLLFFTYIGNP